MRIVRLFVSSPRDAEFERKRVDRVVERLNGELAGVARLETIRYEEEFYSAHATFQDQIPEAADCDIVVAILRHLLGTELPDDFPPMPNGDRYPSGTAYEVLTAIEARKKRDLPDIYVFRYTKRPSIELDDDANALVTAQWEKLKRFFEAWFVTPGGQFKAAFQWFRSTDEFEGQIESLLRKWLEEKVIKGRSVVWPIATKGSPFRGLAAFGAKHAPVFFGRSSSIAKATDSLKDAAARGAPFLLILGSSGSGKSSLVHAGLVPRLTTPGVTPNVDIWRVVAMRPSEHAKGPLAALAGRLFDNYTNIGEEDKGRLAALPEIAESDYGTPADLAGLLSRADDASVRPILGALERVGEAERTQSNFDRSVRADLLLVVDQLDELFAGDVEEDQRNAFARLLSALAATGRVWIAATLRADLYERYLRQPELLDLKTQGAALDLAYPAAAEMAEIVRGPATAADLVYEADPETGERLDDRILRDVDQPDMLPLLEFTLNRLFEQRRTQDSETRLTIAAYEALGGLAGAIDKEAERAVSALGAAERDRLPRLLRQLAAPAQRSEAAGQSTALAIRSVPVEDAAHDAPSERLIRALIEARILLSAGDEDRATIRLAHQRVLESWQRAREIIAANADFYRIRQDVEDQQSRWQASGRRRDLLIPSGLPLAEAESIVGPFANELSPQIGTFIAASRRRSRRRQRLTAGAAVVFALIAVVALWQYRTAHEARIAAIEQRERAERSLEFALSTADSLALDVVRELARNYTIPTSAKLFFADRIDQRFGALLGQLDGSSELRLRYADLLTSIAFMLLDTGWYGEAKESAERAHALLPPDIQPGSPASMIAARTKIALARGGMAVGRLKRAARLLNEAQALLGQVKATKWSSGRDAITRAELASAQFRLLYYEKKWILALKVYDRVRTSFERSIEEAKLDSYVALALFSKLLSMDLIAFNINDALFVDGLDTRVKRFRDHLGQAKPFFANGRSPKWAYYDAMGYLHEARLQAQTSQLDDALATVDMALNKLKQLLAQDYQNLVWRHAIVSALVSRARFALQAADFYQARADLEAARTFSMSMLRDSGVNHLTLQHALAVAFTTGRLQLAQRHNEQALREFAKLLGGANWARNNGWDPRLVTGITYQGHYGQAQAYLATGKHGEALASISAGLELLQRLVRVYGPTSYVDKREITLRSDMLRALAPSDKEMAWQNVYKDLMAQIKGMIENIPNSRSLRAKKVGLLAAKGARLARAGANAEATAIYARAAKQQLSIATLDPRDVGLLATYVLYQRQRLELLATAETWDDAAAVAEAARLALVQAKPAKQPVRGESLSRQWNKFVSTLEAAVESAEREVTASGSGPLQRELTLAKDASDDVAALTSRRRRAAQWQTLLGGKRDAAIRRFQSLFGSAFNARRIQQLAFRSTFNALRRDHRGRIQRVRTLPLPFYDEGALFEVEYLSDSGIVYVLTLLSAGGSDYLLDGGSKPIHLANAAAPLDLGDWAAVFPYVRFYIAYGGLGGVPGRLIDSPDDIPWTPNAPIELRRLVSNRLPRLALRSGLGNIYWQIGTAVQHGTSIYRVVLNIGPTGILKIVDERPVAVLLPIEPPQYAASWRVRQDRTLAVWAFGESPVVNEIGVLVDLSCLGAAERPAHYLDLAELAAFLQQATGGTETQAIRTATGLYRAAGRFAEAYRFALRHMPGNRRELARLALLVGDAQRALEIANAALQTLPTFGSEVRFLFQLQWAHAKAAMGNVDAALAIYRQNAAMSIDGKPWLEVAREQLAELETAGTYADQIAEFRAALAGIAADLKARAAEPPGPREKMAMLSFSGPSIAICEREARQAANPPPSP